MSLTPPNDLGAERSFLGAAMLDAKVAGAMVDQLSADDFYAPKHGDVWLAICRLVERGEPADEVTVAGELASLGLTARIGGAAALSEIIDETPTAANAGHYAGIVRRKAKQRRLIAYCNEAVAAAYDGKDAPEELADRVAGQLNILASDRAQTTMATAKELMRDAYKRIQWAYENRGKVIGVASGFPDLDKITCGFQPGTLSILAARPSMGKTALALAWLQNAAASGVTGLAFSMEMSRIEIAMRMVGAEAGVDGMRLRSGRVADGDWPKLARASESLTSGAGFLVDDAASLTIREIRARARSAKASHGVGIVFVDYLQLARAAGTTQSREREVAEISQGLKALAKELSVPVVALSQLNRGCEYRPDKRPILGDLRDSGSIEQDADLVMFVYRDEYYDKESQDKGIAEVLIRKQRNGPTGMVKLRFWAETTRFASIANEGKY